MDALVTRSDLPSAIAQTEVLNSDIEPTQTTQVLRLRLQKPRSERRVGWTEGTLDNEHMNKKKSKCCCIFKKPTKFGESSSEDDEDCEHCFGHPEKRKKNRKDHKHTEECEHNSSIVSDNELIQSNDP